MGKWGTEGEVRGFEHKVSEYALVWVAEMSGHLYVFVCTWFPALPNRLNMFSGI